MSKISKTELWNKNLSTIFISSNKHKLLLLQLAPVIDRGVGESFELCQTDQNEIVWNSDKLDCMSQTTIFYFHGAKTKMTRKIRCGRSCETWNRNSSLSNKVQFAHSIYWSKKTPGSVSRPQDHYTPHEILSFSKTLVN